jgi:hypothetical protein
MTSFLALAFALALTPVSENRIVTTQGVEDLRAIVSEMTSPERVETVLESLADIGIRTRPDVPQSIRLLRNKDESIRRVAANALRGVRDERAVDSLINALRDPDEIVGGIAADALGELKVRRAVPSLIRVLEDRQECEILLERVSIALGKIGDEAGAEKLLAVFCRHGNHDTSKYKPRIAAASGLALFSDPRASALLTKVAGDTSDDPYVRRAALGALASRDGAKAVDLLRKVAENSSESRFLRAFAAVSAVNVTHGATDDDGLVKPILGYCDSVDGVPYDEEGARRSLELVAENGVKWRVRFAAWKAIREQWGFFSTHPIAMWFSLVYYPAILAGWAFFCRKSLRRRQFTLQSFFILILLMSIGLPILAIALK